MLEFSSPRTRIFRKPRIGYRAIALTAIVAGVVCLGTLFLTSEAPVPATALAETEIMTPAPNVIQSRSPEMENMKAAFDAKPGSTYAEAPEGKTKAILNKIAAIPAGISNLLQAGSDFMVSKKKLAVGKGDTLMNLLVENNVPRDQAYNAIQALSKVYDPRALNPGHEITVFFHQDPSIADPQFSGLQIEKDIVNTVTVNRGGDGNYEVNQQEKAVHRVLRGFRGTIDSSLYVSAKAQGVPDGVILDLIKMYSWNVDFQRDIRNGDLFEVMYEEYVTDAGDTVPGKSSILYAKLGLDGNIMPFYRYTDSSGDSNYYDTTGRSAKKSLMKTPIDGARLSSGFGMRRHPVLGYSKMHKGLDFAAPRGTPIYAAGDGVIQRMGPFSSYGNYVRIRHQNGLETAYAHMKGFKSSLRSGSRVRQGQVIGYVGTTGRSTGPHLHYEILMGGKQVNPASVKMPTGKALKGKDFDLLKSVVAQMDRQFQKLGEGGTVLAENAAARRPFGH